MYSSSNIIRAIRLRIKRWAEYIARKGKMRSVYTHTQNFSRKASREEA